jgi:hypothetical protein
VARIDPNKLALERALGAFDRDVIALDVNCDARRDGDGESADS